MGAGARPPGGGSQLAGPGELARRPGAGGRGGLRGGQRGGQALGVAPPAGAAMWSRGGSTRGARGTERGPRDLMLGLVRTRPFACRNRHVPPGWRGKGGGGGGGWGGGPGGWGGRVRVGGEGGGGGWGGGGGGWGVGGCGGWGGGGWWGGGGGWVGEVVGGGVQGYILGDKHYNQRNGGASRMASPPSTLDRYIYIHSCDLSSVGDDRGGGCMVMTYRPVDG